MSFLKLCQLVNQSETEVFYQEDANGNILVNNPTFPISIDCEVIDWVSEEEFLKRGKIISFQARTVIIETQPENIRQSVYETLLTEFPALNI